MGMIMNSAKSIYANWGGSVKGTQNTIFGNSPEHWFDKLGVMGSELFRKWSSCN